MCKLQGRHQDKEVNWTTDLKTGQDNKTYMCILLQVCDSVTWNVAAPLDNMLLVHNDRKLP